MAMTAKQLNKYIEKRTPWEKGATGPNSFDCQGWVHHVSKKYYNTTLPNVEVNVDSLLSIVKSISKNKVWDLFEEIQKPEDGCVCKLVTSENPNHLGIYLKQEGGGIAHCLRGRGVVWDNMFTIKQSYARTSFWKYIGEPDG